MPTDTSERGLERLICLALTGSRCEAGSGGEGFAESGAAYGGAGWICGDPADYDREHATDLAQLSVFLEQFGNIQWTDTDRVHRMITEEIPAKVAADAAYQNAKKNSDRQNARIEHDKALGRVMTALLKDDTELFKRFSDDPAFKRWLADAVFSVTYPPDAA